METKPPLPPFTEESARQKVRMAEDAWNTRDPDRVVLVYTADTRFSCSAVSPASTTFRSKPLSASSSGPWAGARTIIRG